jgi:carboxyl-terminal processing protease
MKIVGRKFDRLRGDIGAPKKRRFNSFIVGIFCLGLIAGVAATQGLDLYISSRTSHSPISSNGLLPDNLDYAEVEEVYDSLRKNYDGELKLEDIFDGLKNGLAQATGDPYTTYFTESENEEFNGEVNGTFSGIGAELLSENNVIIVSTPLSGFPAEKAGLKARDVILKIDEEDATSLSVTEAVKLIRGDVGTTVKLTILRGNEQLEFSIVRATITIPSVSHKIEDDIGYMQITRFGEDTYDLAVVAANDFIKNKVKGVIVDVRNNPGGYLDQAVAVSSLWVSKGKTVVEERRGDVTEKIEKALGGNILGNYKTVILINGGSASASEILAGALKDNGEATLLGEKTFGKGSVQQVDEFIGGSALKVTIAKWYTPKGKNINKEGISPDTEVVVTTDQITAGIDSQKEAAMALF